MARQLGCHDQSQQGPENIDTTHYTNGSNLVGSGTQFPDPTAGFWEVVDPITIMLGPKNSSNADQLSESLVWCSCNS